ncbi:MAG: SDR family oxidoreductase [Propionibacteriaceae bacterium]|jgi:NAD(P)-dependent dehydrogenase (short-subunit alcohol dehydrogenase family)|nr:SDR family oxidoreductase [Propionibacteriaceae bacterium]
MGRATEDLGRGRPVVVTGAGSGIGRAVVDTCLEQGYAVLACARPGPKCDRLREELADRALVAAADTADEAQVEALFEICETRLGPPWGVVANAGRRQPRTPVLELASELWDAVLDNNLRGAFLVDRRAAQSMARAGGGSIVNLSSVSGKVARTGQTAYAVSKAAIDHLTEVLALELARHGIRVNAVSPGTTSTPMIELAQAQDSADLLAERVAGSLELYRPGIPLGRLATAQDQADAICFLLSDRARHITGQVLQVDGGETVV